MGEHPGCKFPAKSSELITSELKHESMAWGFDTCGMENFS